jgi:hypothetical protein
MSSERRRGVLLYALAGVLLFAGGLWFHRAAPAPREDPRVKGWRTAAARLLPDLPFQAAGGTVVLPGGTSTQRDEAVEGGPYALSMVCLAEGGSVRVRLSTSGEDSGRAVPCAAESPESVSLTVGLADDFFMDISAETGAKTAVFRWRLDRVRGF